ncbi:unnamed protein product [Didymodactylos carnosus]|uniref:histone acetyltransferase n=1 Tax=Didymodactylos carnosus TaxID=1234261 RepID=A0A8S2EJS3_9BILA|nr:unnamed protein product [Didymodactylos carnosus]CAF4009287.1 unnamed protein product [Didymodactylos carnosus]
MNKFHCCNGGKLQYTPEVLYCWNLICQRKIKRKSKYYCKADPTGDRIVICTKCHELGKQLEFQDAYDDPNSSWTLMKHDFAKDESTTSCSLCYRQYHDACILIVKELWPENRYICTECTVLIPRHDPQHVYSVDALPKSIMSEYIENKIQQLMSSADCSKHQNIYVRVACSHDNKFDTNNDLIELYETGIPASHRYTSQTILLFHKIDGISVLLLIMYVQEYDEKQFVSNKNRIMISYLDTVNFRSLGDDRQMIYFTMIISYLDYMRQFGYTSVYLWVSPPKAGIDYIFNHHPVGQNMPSFARLRSWYEELLIYGTKQKVIRTYQDLSVEKKRWKAGEEVYCLPYMEGDTWPKRIRKALNYDLCMECYSNENHEHEMRKTDPNVPATIQIFPSTTTMTAPQSTTPKCITCTILNSQVQLLTTELEVFRHKISNTELRVLEAEERTRQARERARQAEERACQAEERAHQTEERAHEAEQNAIDAERLTG